MVAEKDDSSVKSNYSSALKFKHEIQGKFLFFKILQQNFNFKDRDGQNLLEKMESG